MDFGKLPSVDGVDFALPPDPAANALVLRGLSSRGGPIRIYLGPTGYNQKEWVGKWYPAGAKSPQFLRYCGEQFGTLEHNTTHYRLPDPATVERWREEVPADFRYCPKVLQAISHARNIGTDEPGLILEFAGVLRGLGDRLGCCFLQLPPYFTPMHLPALETFLSIWPPDVPLAVEVRHEAFFQPNLPAEQYFDSLREAGISTVITDVAGRRDVCHLRLTNHRVLIRFVGNNLHPSDFTRVQAWADRLSDWAGAGLQEAYFFCHEPDNILAPELAAFAAETFAAAMPGARIRGPKPFAQPPAQGSLF